MFYCCFLHGLACTAVAAFQPLCSPWLSPSIFIHCDCGLLTVFLRLSNERPVTVLASFLLLYCLWWVAVSEFWLYSQQCFQLFLSKYGNTSVIQFFCLYCFSSCFHQIKCICAADTCCMWYWSVLTIIVVFFFFWLFLLGVATMNHLFPSLSVPCIFVCCANYMHGFPQCTHKPLWTSSFPLARELHLQYLVSPIITSISPVHMFKIS